MSQRTFGRLCVTVALYATTGISYLLRLVRNSRRLAPAWRGVASDRQVLAHAVALGVDAMIDQVRGDRQRHRRILRHFVDRSTQAHHFVGGAADGDRVQGSSKGGGRVVHRGDVRILEGAAVDDVRGDGGRYVGSRVTAAPA